MKRIVYLVALWVSWALTLQSQAANVIPQAGVYYNIVQTPSGMVFGAVSAQPVVQTATKALNQAFEFVPVEGKTDTYYIKSFYGLYLNKVASSGWNVTYQSAINGTNSEWVITDDASSTSVFRLMLNANSKYLATDAITTNSNLYCDKAADHVRGLFTLAAATIPTNLVAAYNALTLGGITEVTSNLTLPAISGPANIPVSWTSSLPSVIATDGTVTQPDNLDATVKLTATMSDVVDGVTFTMTKDFLVTVKAKTVVDDILANWDFAQDSIYIENGAIKVKSSSTLGYVGTVMNDASIRTIGTSEKYNVLYTGDGTGYFDMGTEIGKAIYSLNNYSMAGYFRIDADNTNLSNDGNFIWNFSNTADAPTDKNGYIIGSLKNQAQNVTSSYWASGDQGVGLNTNAPKDGWHHIAFTQKGIVGTVYVDGVQVAQNTAMTNLPSTTLPIAGRTGTLYNWLGRSCYPGDNYLKKTMIYGFQLLKNVLTPDDLSNGFGTSEGVTATIEKLNVAYAENPNYLLPELSTEADNLTLGDLSAVTSNIPLPTKGSLDPSISISWKSTNTALINVDGVVTRHYNPNNVTLTATLSKNGQKATKTFTATVLAKEGAAFTSDLLAKYDFASVTNDTIVTDAAEKHFAGKVKNDAKIRTIGTAETGVINVLDLGNGTGYFDMGTEVGELVSNLTDYTVGAYYRIDPTYTEIKKNGNFLWNFSNSKDIINNPTGYIIGSLRNQAATITPDNWSSEKTVAVGDSALKNNWHHFAYTQKGSVGTIYVDGQPQIAGNEITTLPSTALLKEGSLGTLYNWIGRSCYTGDVYLRKTLVADFRLYKTALTDEQIQTSVLNVSNHINALEAAYAANPNIPAAIKTVTESQYKVIASVGSIRILGLSGDEKVSLFDITGRQFKVTNPAEIALKSGVYIVKVNGYITKVVVR